MTNARSFKKDLFN